MSVWDWTAEKEGPCCTSVLTGIANKQQSIAFSENDVTQLVSNGDEQVIFYYWVCTYVCSVYTHMYSIFLSHSCTYVHMYIRTYV